jgi:rod shape-determining protein MreB
VLDAARAAGARQAFVIKETVAAAIGAGIPIGSAAGNLVIDIGGGTTDVAVLSLGGIVNSTSVRVAGNRLDQAISDYVRRKHGLAIGDRTAEEIKITIGSAIRLPEEEVMETKGRDVITGLPRTITVATNEIVESIQEDLQEMVRAIKTVLEDTPPELIADIIDKGMVMTGGTALLRNLDRYIAQAIGVPCFVAEDPLLCVAKGTGVALDNLDSYKRSILSIK